MTFKERHRELQELVRELILLRKHNLQFTAGQPQTELLMFAEAAVVLVVLERFLRIVVGADGNGQTIFNLLQMATSTERQLLKLPGDRDTAIRSITDVRNTLLHGDYEKAARDSGLSTVSDYFKTKFAGEIEALYRLTDALMKQIDAETGRPIHTS